MGSNIPVYVVAFNQATYVKDIVGQLRKYTKHIIIVDNASTYGPLLAFYETLANDPVVQVIRRDRNDGHKVVTTKLYDELPDVFAITDPDLSFPDTMPIDALEIMRDVGVSHNAAKVGVALDISESLNFDNLKLDGTDYTIRGWERRWWDHPIPHTTLSLFDADIDTTLAVYNKKINTGRVIRIAGDYTTIHRPWLKDNGMSRDEQNYYVDQKRCGAWVVRKPTETIGDTDDS